jgi:hypothetical protein
MILRTDTPLPPTPDEGPPRLTRPAANKNWPGVPTPAGEQLFDTCLGCSHPGVVELRPGGRYTLAVGGGDAATGAYSLQLTRVPPPDRFALELGSKPVKIAEGVSAAGAGTIEVPGARDLYNFTAQPKARVGFYLGSASSG